MATNTLQNGLTSFVAGLLAAGPDTISVTVGKESNAAGDSPAFIVATYPQSAVREQDDTESVDAKIYVVQANDVLEAIGSVLGQLSGARSVAVYGATFSGGQLEQISDAVQSVVASLHEAATQFAQSFGEPDNGVRH